MQVGMIGMEKNGGDGGGGQCETSLGQTTGRTGQASGCGDKERGRGKVNLGDALRKTSRQWLSPLKDIQCGTPRYRNDSETRSLRPQEGLTSQGVYPEEGEEQP